MTHNDARDEMQDGFDLAPLPAMGAEGAGTALSEPPRASPPRLCEAGPCANYHRFEIQTDAAVPGAVGMPIRNPDGTPGVQLVAPDDTATPFHIEVHHYCYPTSGVETRLGSLPVIRCNRWHPMVPRHPWRRRRTRDEDREAFLRSEAGRAFASEVTAWEAAQGYDQADADEAQRLMAMSLPPP